MNLICFPHYTAGGLLCDILSDTYSPMDNNGGILSILHTVGKIGDTDTVLIDYDAEEFMQTVASKQPGPNDWIGTHCWPGNLPTDQFEQVILITTATDRSKIYRWLRAYHHYFAPLWTMSGMELIDKLRETAKNYTISFDPLLGRNNVVNIELADIVENTAEFAHLTNGCDTGKHLARWQEINSFLYKNTLWNDLAVKAFYQAQHELALNRHYIYN